jgi:hypothetical protein
MGGHDMDSDSSDARDGPRNRDGRVHPAPSREDQPRAGGLREGGWRGDLERRSFHLDETQTDTRLLFVDNLYNAMEVVGGVTDCTAHDKLDAITDAWNELELAPFYYNVIRNQAPELVALLDALQGATDE